MAAPPLKARRGGPNPQAALHFLLALGRNPHPAQNRPQPQMAQPSPVPPAAGPPQAFSKGTGMSVAKDARLDRKAGIKEGSPQDIALDKKRGVPQKKHAGDSVHLQSYAKGSGLSAAQRRALPSSTFAGPGRSFPIPDKKHAKAALMDINHAPPAARAKIRARADAKLRS